jgi:hypothetical protein
MTKLIIVLGVTLFIFFVWSRFLGGWRVLHQKIIGLLLIAYGAYLATLTGTVTQFVLPGIGAVGGGAATGAGVGFVTWLVLGTVGVATGGVGLAIGATAMTLIGGALGAAGAATGGAGFATVTYPLVSPIFWVPLVLLGIYFNIGARKRKTMQEQTENA